MITLQATDEHAVGLDQYFLEMSHPAESMSLPENQATYAEGGPEKAIAVGNETGVKISSRKKHFNYYLIIPDLSQNVNY